MSKGNVDMLGNLGTYVDDNNVITFQMGEIGASSMDRRWSMDEPKPAYFAPRFMNVNGYQVASRGVDNRSCEQIEKDIKGNRLLPRLFNKQNNFLYGKGLFLYKENIVDSKIVRTWIQTPDQVLDWLESWKANGMEDSYTDFALAVIKRFYYFRDFFVKFRMSAGKSIGRYPIAGMELVENKLCRLATKKEDVINDTVLYKDFRFVLFGDWQKGAAKYKVYPLFNIAEVDNYKYAAISHHKESSVGDYYGLNETHEGVKTFLKTSNELPVYIDSFLSNALAAKIHVIIPNAWVESKRKQIKTLCDENKKRKKESLDLLKYNGIEIGTEFKEPILIQFITEELRRLSDYLSGAKNQGKAYASYSFKSDRGGEEERWRIETIDLKYKEYIEALTKYDERVDEVLISAVGIDSSISAVSKPGVISKSGSDAYYNFIIYLMSLTPDDRKCAEPFNLALQLNFPDIYSDGYRFGFYREIPSRQEEVSPTKRLNEQQV